MKQSELDQIAKHLEHIASLQDHSYDEGMMYAEGIRRAARIVKENCGTLIDEHEKHKSELP